MLSPIRRPRRPGRRGVTLVEMLVVVALVILMMVILVQIFQSATGAMTASRTSTELDLVLRQIDSVIRTDLAGVTAYMTPPNNPKDKTGYFEYGEQAPADAQGEDTDDYMAFTTKAPEGQFFTGRQWLSGSSPQPTAISSQVAEVLYFLRNGNLYRRVLLVAPERAKSITPGTTTGGGYLTSMFGVDPSTGGALNVSWQGMNDISCRPNTNPYSVSHAPIPNDLGDLTNRENRIFRPRFFNDFNTNGSGTGGPDGIPDDFNLDGRNDYYPTLYYNGAGGYAAGTGWAPNGQVHEGISYPSAAGSQRVAQGTGASHDVYAFPFIFPEMYSVADPNVTKNYFESIHYLYPNILINHAPLTLGDNLALPTANQTWWGFPTWRETMAGLNITNNTVGWTDPIKSVQTTGNYQQPFGLQTLATPTLANSLPPLTMLGSTALPPFADNSTAGATNFVAIPSAPTRVWEDDLVLTNVRSFDIKAYDLNAGLYNAYTGLFKNPNNGLYSAGYQDLGYGANPYNVSSTGTSIPGDYIGGPNGLGASAQVAAPWQAYGGEPVGFGHEGRIPPLTSDFRYHPRRPTINVGDNNSGVNRLNRVFDSWSTDYTNAPDTDLFLSDSSTLVPPLYPSFPPPYPSPLRGIQIQIRVVDPRGERSKILTIRHDFTDRIANPNAPASSGGGPGS